MNTSEPLKFLEIELPYSFYKYEEGEIDEVLKKAGFKFDEEATCYRLNYPKSNLALKVVKLSAKLPNPRLHFTVIELK